MKNFLRSFLLFTSFVLAASALQAGVPALDVTVANDKGKVAFKGKTQANGTFATPALEPGDYTVQFNARSAISGDYELVLSAGKQKVLSGSVPAAKFTRGGVAMRIKVAQSSSISGQVLTGGTSAASAAPAAAPGGAKVKIMNGKRYVWVGPETGSHIGGRWVEEGSVMQSSVLKGGSEALSAKDNKSGGR